VDTGFFNTKNLFKFMKKIIAVTVCLALTACATRPSGENYQPIIDTKGVDTVRLESDLHECQAYARQVAGAAQQAAAGAVAGALLGAILAAAAGSRYSRNQHAAVGAVAGMSSGAVAGERDQRDIIRRCMAGRGYNVLQ
jgi:outer membrane lipoprotein SlyB